MSEWWRPCPPGPPQLPGGTLHPCPAQGPGAGTLEGTGHPKQSMTWKHSQKCQQFIDFFCFQKKQIHSVWHRPGGTASTSSHTDTRQGTPGSRTPHGSPARHMALASVTPAVHLPARLHEGQERVTASRECHGHSTEDTCQRARPHGSVSLSHLKRHILSPEGSLPSDCWGAEWGWIRVQRMRGLGGARGTQSSPSKGHRPGSCCT